MVKVTRRRLLTGALAFAAPPLLFSSPVKSATNPGFAAAPRLRPEIRARWKTGNRRLVPLTLSGDHLFAAGETSLECWRVSTGQADWRVDITDDQGASFRPRLAGDWILNGSREGLSAWSRADGRLGWRYQPKQGQLAVPYVHDGRAYLGEDHRLLALNVDTGQVDWSFATDASAKLWYAPTRWGQTILLGAGDGRLYGLDADSGELLWHVDREKDWQYLRQLYVDNETLVAGGYKDELFGIDPSNGKVLWRFDAGNFINSQLVRDGAAYFWSPTGWIYAIDISIGKPLWRHQTTDYGKGGKKTRNWAPIMAELVADQSRLYILAMNHIVHVLDRQSGDEVVSYKFGESVRPFLVLKGDGQSAFFASTTGEILDVHLV